MRRCGCRSRLTSSKLTVPVGNSETEAPPRSTGSRPGHGADFGFDRVAHRVRGHQKRQDHESADAGNGQAQDSKSKAFDANGRDHDASFSSARRSTGRLYRGRSKGQTCSSDCKSLQLLCDAFVAAQGTNPAVVSGVFARFEIEVRRYWRLVVRLGLAADLVERRRRARARSASCPRRPSCRW